MLEKEKEGQKPVLKWRNDEKGVTAAKLPHTDGLAMMETQSNRAPIVMRLKTRSVAKHLHAQIYHT